jgi:hypothetical protein
MGSSLTTGPDTNLGNEVARCVRMKALPENMLKQSYEVEVLINGKPAKEYAHKGKVYLEGREGTKFTIRLRNNSYSRKLFVPTIDGLSVMDGEEGSFKSSGYIVEGHSSITVDGWRTSDKEVAEFYFSSPEGSYRKKMNKGNNLGIIGVAVFGETYQGPWMTSTATQTLQNNWPTGTLTGIGGSFPQWTTISNGGGTIAGINSVNTTSGNGDWVVTANYGAGANGNYNLQSSAGAGISSLSANNNTITCSSSVGSAQTQALGTGWGDTKSSEVISVNFDRLSSPEAVFELQYNSRQELEKAGINFKKAPLYVVPQAFPGQYCKPPVHDVIKTDSCYVCTKCGKAAGDGDGFIGEVCSR